MKLQKELGVLVIDDDPLVLKYTAAALTAQGYKNIRTATSAGDARACLFAQRFGTIICDIYLPDGDGRQLLREAFAINPASRAILISAFVYRGLMIPPDLYGKVELLEKPFTEEELQDLLGGAVARHSARGSR
jgi:two-component system, NtrC family, C4-dicarboxylate transport response regulator DctD